MKSLANQLKDYRVGDLPTFSKNIEKFESAHYKLKNDHAELHENFAQLTYELSKLNQSHQLALTEISKKLNKTLKGFGDDAMVTELALSRAKVLDHFVLAYMAELGLKPSEIKMVQGFDKDGYVEVYFEKNSKILLPGEQS